MANKYENISSNYKDSMVEEPIVMPELAFERPVFITSNKVKFNFIDLFAGIGGFRIAMQNLSGNCVFSSEFEPNAQKTYRANFGEIPQGDITKIDETTIPNHDILCGGFPCQAFSIAGKRKGFDDIRGTLFFDVARIRFLEGYYGICKTLFLKYSFTVIYNFKIVFAQ